MWELTAPLPSKDFTSATGITGESLAEMHSILLSFFMLLGLDTGLTDWLHRQFATANWQMVLDFLPHMAVSMGLGAVLGLERRARGKVAGLRTHMVIAASSCLITLSGVYMNQAQHGIDPTRLAAQILSGIGFVGAGVILRKGMTTSGVTTAATILFSAGIGIACGFGFFAMAALATLGITVALMITYKFLPSYDTGGHSLKVTCRLDKFEQARQMFGVGCRLDGVVKRTDVVEFRVHTNLSSPELDKLINDTVANPDIMSIENVD